MNWHVFSFSDQYYLFDTPSNSLFRIDEPTFWRLRAEAQPEKAAEYRQLLVNRCSQAVREEVEEELAALKQAGYLPERDPFLEEPVFNLKPELKALCLHLTHDCQLRCVYCFAGGGAFGGDRSIMPPAVGRAAIDFLCANSGAKDHLEVDFFGGEPLLNTELLLDLVPYGEEKAAAVGKKMHFTLTTNTLGLSRELLEFLRQHRMGLVLSLDGREAVNDRMRGKGTYQRIVPRIQEVIRDFPEINYYVRGTFTRFNLDFSEDVKHLYELGMRSISIEPVVCAPDLPYALREEDLPRIDEEYDRLAAFYWERHQAGDPFRFFHFVVDLEKGPCLPKRLLGCGAGFDYLAVTPQGELYPCHQFVGEKQFIVGDVFSGITAPEIRAVFGRARFYAKEGCSTCWARYYCSGGCHAHAYFANGDILKPDTLACRLLQKRLECALALNAAQIAEQEKKQNTP
ncbi:MAG: thioether cross-link-forming SCIFF peptide maturase [Firmicutes bacterium]|nr:thioether cross-link-forming SCIFF peptide maturase [Bacillota bacterium]